MLEGFSPRAQERLMANVGVQVTNILETTRDTIRDDVARGLEQGLGGGALGDLIEDSNAFSEYRGELIARTETAIFLNRAATETYRDYGVTHVEVIDGTDDDECAEANGQIWTLEEAEANPIAHPNCVRDFAPIIGEPAAAAEEGGAPEAVGGRDDAAIDAYTDEFAAKYQSDPIEHGAVIDQNGNVVYEAGGIDPELLTAVDEQGFKLAGGQVDWADVQPGTFKDNIVVHTHPGGNTPLSTDDVAHTISHRAAEIRAEARDYSYRMRPGREDGQWFEPIEGQELRGITNTEMRSYYEATLERISGADAPEWLAARGMSPGNIPRGFDLEEAWLSDAWQQTAEHMGWRYDRVLR